MRIRDNTGGKNPFDRNKRLPWPGIVALLVFPFIITFLVEIVARMSLTNAGGWLIGSANADAVRFGYLWLFCAIGLIYAITNRLPLACALGGALVLLPAAIHAGKVMILQQPLIPGDFLLIRTVLTIWDTSYFPFTLWQVGVFVTLCGLTGFLAIWLLPDFRIKKRVRLLAGVLALLALYYFTANVRLISSRTIPMDKKLTVVWTEGDNHARDPTAGSGIQNPDFSVMLNYKNFGFLAGFFQNLSKQIKQEHIPEGYSKESIQAAWQRFYDQAPPVAAEDHSSVRPDVVVVLMESFWDPTWLEGVTIAPDPLASFRSIAASSNATLFTSVSPIFGGYTCKAEFELLSGMAIGVIPPGVVPHRQHFRSHVTTLSSVFKQHGYHTVAIHPFLPEFWNRNIVFPAIGFDRFIHVGTMVNREVRGKFISDDALANEILDTLEGAKEPVFIFAISMQSHSPYGDRRYGNVEQDSVQVSEVAMDADALRDYVHGLRDADAMLDKLTRRLATRERPVELLFLGDHQPSLIPWREDAETAFEHKIRREVIPPGLHVKARYFGEGLFWSSRGTPPPGRDTPVGLPQLTLDVLRQAHLPRPPYMQLAERVFEAYPVLQRGWAITATGQVKVFAHEFDALLLRDYQMISYDILVGRNYSRSTLETLAGNRTGPLVKTNQ